MYRQASEEIQEQLNTEEMQEQLQRSLSNDYGQEPSYHYDESSQKLQNNEIDIDDQSRNRLDILDPTSHS